MNQLKFTEEFFEEFQYDAEFRSIFEAMTRGLTPYEAIEHLCKSKTDIDTDENIFTTLTPELMDIMISEFSHKHKEDIQLLEAKINSKVKVEFGFVYDVH